MNVKKNGLNTFFYKQTDLQTEYRQNIFIMELCVQENKGKNIEIIFLIHVDRIRLFKKVQIGIRFLFSLDPPYLLCKRSEVIFRGIFFLVFLELPKQFFFSYWLGPPPPPPLSGRVTKKLTLIFLRLP